MAPRVPGRSTPRGFLAALLAAAAFTCLAAVTLTACRTASSLGSLRPLWRSIQALNQVETMRFRLTAREPVVVGWDARTTTFEAEGELVTYEGGLSRLYYSHEGAPPDETVCTQEGCWWRVGDHPWAETEPLFGFNLATFLETRQLALVAAEVTDTGYDDDTAQLVVSWRTRLPFVGGEFGGQSWLDSSTFLPAREILRETDDSGYLLYEWEITYLEFGRPIRIETPVPATVTPVPTVSLGDRPSYPVYQEGALPYGIIYAPEAPGPHPGVVLLGDARQQAAMAGPLARRLASAGFVALAHCYTSCPGAPATLAEVEVESVVRAMEVVRGHSEVAATAPIALVGEGRGGELALITAALYDEVGAVVAISAPSRIAPGYPPEKPAWVHGGTPLPWGEVPADLVRCPVLILHGQHDRRVPVLDAYRTADRIRDAGGHVELAVYPREADSLAYSHSDMLARTVDLLDRVLR